MSEISTGLATIWTALYNCFTEFIWKIPVLQFLIILMIAGAIAGVVIGGIFAFKK